jgi:hypothetical protein
MQKILNSKNTNYLICKSLIKYQFRVFDLACTLLVLFQITGNCECQNGLKSKKLKNVTMKTRFSRLMVTMFTLAAVTTISINPVNAQEKTRRERTGAKVTLNSDEVNVRDQNKGGNADRNNGDFYTRNPEYKQNKNGTREEKSSFNNKSENKNSGDRISQDKNKSFRNEDHSNFRNNPEENRKGDAERFNDRYNHGNNRYENGRNNAFHNNNLRIHRDYRFSKNYYYHPRYGHVIRRFDVSPLIFSFSRGRLFYSDGCFFDYQPGIGYVAVDYPYNYLFTNLPAGNITVGFRGHVYFSVGNLFFEMHHGGFRLVPSSHAVYHHYLPGQVYFSSRF